MNASQTQNDDFSAPRGPHIQFAPRRRTQNFTPSKRLIRRTRQTGDGATIYFTKRFGEMTPYRAAKVGAR
jgi:hypothetical protein